MPAAFNRCRRAGGRIRTKEVSGGRYVHICFNGAKAAAGEVKKKKKK